MSELKNPMDNVNISYARATRLFVVFMVAVDVLATVLAFTLAYLLRISIPFPNVAEGMPPYEQYLPMLLIQVGALLAVFSLTNQYDLQKPSRSDEFGGVIAGATVSTLIAVAVASLSLREIEIGQEYSRVMVGYTWVLTMILMVLGRLSNGWVRRRLVRRGWGRRRVLVVGTGDVGRMILQKVLWTPELGYEAVGVVHMLEDAPESLFDVPVVGDVEKLDTYIEQLAVDEVILALPEEISHTRLMSLIAKCEHGRVTVRVYPDMFQIVAGDMSVSELGGIPVLTVRDVAQTGWRRTAKRLVDLVGSAAALVVLSPMMMLIAVAVKLESPGPAFYVQERMGLDARPFPVIKFRSMRQDAEKFGPGWTTEDDPRKTKTGTFLRKTNLDELPQFINILVGDMSLVGPRPERPVYVEQFRRSIPRYMERHREKAGLTGWAQVNGYRGDTSITERTKYDLWYIQNWSLWLDIKIIIRTAWKFFDSPNAY